MKYFPDVQPVLHDEHGEAFVFWNSDKLFLSIRHGNYITTIHFDESPDTEPFLFFTEDSEKKDRLPDEKLIYDHRGHVVASYSPTRETMFIKRRGRTGAIRLPNCIRCVQTIRAYA